MLVAKQTQVHAEETHGTGIKITQKNTKSEMPPVNFVGSLCKTNAVLCAKIADVHGIEGHDIRN